MTEVLGSVNDNKRILKYCKFLSFGNFLGIKSFLRLVWRNFASFGSQATNVA
jgi:hypothetical protein